MPELVVSDIKGNICNIPHLSACGMKGGCFFKLSPDSLIKLPPGSELFMLPDRVAIGYDAGTSGFVKYKTGKCFPAAAFISPGFVVTYNSPYIETRNSKILPLFSYSAVCFYKGEFHTAAVRIDSKLRHDLRYMDMDLVRKNSKVIGKLFPGNRLIKQLSDCALVYGCPNAKNFFLEKYEAPLPTSPFCNARCLGCISYQPDKKIPFAQPRIRFIPSPSEVLEAALYHIKNAQNPIVSFGQGCEGEPLLQAELILRSIRLIRERTNKGIINCNTNGSRPEAIARLCDAGLGSCRISLNSVRETYYTRYFKPKDYGFADVIKSIKTAKRKGCFVSINYLTMPGFTDSTDEFSALKEFIEDCRIDMIQWRNLNYDPLRYGRELRISADKQKMLGIREIIDSLKLSFPHLMMGYFNPADTDSHR